MPKSEKRNPGLPTREQILDFIASSPTPAGKREIAKAFGLSAQDKIALKALLKDMADEGLIDSAPGRAFHKMGGVPKVTVLRVADVDDSGNVWAVPERWDAETPPPKLRVRERKHGALAVGDRVLARTEEAGNGWIAHPMKVLPKGEELVLGVLRQEGATLWLQGVEKKERREFQVSDAGDAQPGDLVLAERAGRPPRITVRVTQVLGDPFAPRSFSLIAIHKLGIPDVFSPETLEEAVRVAGQSLGDKREDLRDLPIVAIDPADARDHDDAVWAAPDDDPSNEGGWKAIVAIADVSFYVRPGSQLDREARRRGNSVYFPDRVVPMLPESLSAEMCSLKEGVDRAALVCHLRVGKDGTLKSWCFTRAVVRIAANIAYEDAQAIADTFSRESESPEPSSAALETLDPRFRGGTISEALKPLWSCWDALYKARTARAPLDLDLPERRVVLDEKGRILSVAPRERLDSMRLIEDYMIAANVAAAKALEAKKAPVMYRVHEQPSREKLVALKDYLKTYGIEFALGQVVRPATFNHILSKLDGRDERPQIMEQVLRTQTQAYYAPANMGHFGLALGSYGHFTSPIRRYADLLVHRALVTAYDLGPGGLTEGEAASMEKIGESISMLERRAMEAERDTIDRYVAAFLSEKVGEVLETRITGVTNFGFFATVEGIGGDGLMPVRDLGGEYFRFDEASRTLVGEHSGTVFASGQKLSLRLAEANPVSGALRFERVEGRGARPERDERKPGPGRVIKRRGRPANIRHQGRSVEPAGLHALADPGGLMTALPESPGVFSDDSAAETLAGGGVSTSERHYVFGLDIIRAAAVSLVVISHLQLGFLLPGVPGVELFFVLSGYLVGGIFFKTIAVEGKANFTLLLRFWQRRWARTLPNYFLFMTVFILVFPETVTGWSQIGRYLVFLQNLSKPISPFFGLSWSLAVEEWFYILLPGITMIVLGATRRPLAAILSTTMLLIVGAFVARFLSHPTDANTGMRMVVAYRLDALAIGVVCAVIAQRLPDIWRILAKFWVIGGAALFALSAVLMSNTATLTGPLLAPLFTAIPLASAMLIARAVQVPDGDDVIRRGIKHVRPC